MTIKHSIVMVCYNQEQYIRTALDSLLCEQVQPDEIIIGDDCSTDGTRNILAEYKAKYPDIIKLVLNERNLGIFANINNITGLPTGDMIHFLAGDDWYSPGFLHKVNLKISELRLDPCKERFLLLPDIVNHKSNGSEQILRNDPVTLSHYSPVGLMVRGIVHQRLVGISRALFNCWPPHSAISAEMGPWADRVQHIMFMQYVDRQILMDCPGPVYRIGVGIASKTPLDAMERSFQSSSRQLYNNYLSGELSLSELDVNYLHFLIQCWDLRFDFSFASLLLAFKLSVTLLKMDPFSKRQVIREFYGLFRRITLNLLRRTWRQLNRAVPLANH